MAALARDAGHAVTCLARGESGSVPDGVTLVRGDRSTADAYAALPPLASWDLVVDVARQPGHVRGAIEALADRAGHWAFVSSCSVYARHDEPGADERAALLPALEDDEATPEQYGEGKVACEQAVLAALGDRSLVARAGLIVGAGDRSDRFGYWPGRFALAARQDRPVLVPVRDDLRVQVVHVDDLAGWLVEAGLRRATGVVNAIGPTTALREVLEGAAAVAGFEGELVRATDAELEAAGVDEFMGPRSLPLWLRDPEWQAFMDRDVSAAAALGLRHRPLADSLRDALVWEEQLGLDRERQRAGLSPQDEVEAIDAVRANS